MKRIRLLIVDDSSTMRALIRASVRDAADIEVVGEAADPIEARDAIKRLNPDVLTLDIEMPHMDGLSFLEKIMRLRPMPVIIVSTLTRRGAEVTLQALELGAIDCIEKPRPGNEESLAEIPGRLRIAARANVSAPSVRPPPPPATAPRSGPQADGTVIAIGASTGGVEALLSVISTFPANCAPTLIVQHMPPVFTGTFAQRLDRTCAPRVVEATHGAALVPGTVYIAPGGDAHLEVLAGREPRCGLRVGERVNHHCPSVDVMFHSVAKAFGTKSRGVLLTGMGRDGASGLLEMRQAGARTLAQDEATSIVYGMPRAAVEIGAAARQLPLHQITYQTIIAGGSAAAADARKTTSPEAPDAYARHR